jgi:hypothetical protein
LKRGRGNEVTGWVVSCRPGKIMWLGSPTHGQVW